MRNCINALLKTEAEYKAKSAEIAELEQQLKGFQESVQYNLEKKAKLPPKTGAPKSDEEIAAKDREIRQLRQSISQLHFWDVKEKRRLSALLKEKEALFMAEYSVYRTHEDWKRIEKDIDFFSERVASYEIALASRRPEREALVRARTAALTELTAKVNAAPAESLKSAFSAQECAALPAAVISAVIKKCKCNLWPSLPVSLQVKLLYPYDTTISFGGYSWNVLEIRKDRALLLMNGLCYTGALCGSNEKTPIDWDTCYAHKYLNGTFLDKLKSKKQGKICHNQDGDYVFLLSKSEAEQYLEYKQMAVFNGAWWLRDVSNYDEFSIASCVDSFRQISTQYPSYEKDAHGNSLGYRPALWVKLNPGEVENWEENRFPIYCKGLWSTKGKYDNTSISLTRVMEIMRDLDRDTPTNSDPMGYGDGVPVDSTGM